MRLYIENTGAILAVQPPEHYRRDFCRKVCRKKRAPALLDNLSQAFLMAPFFVLLELLQSLFGYGPYPGFHANVLKKIEVHREQWPARK
ncbi:hypothetical protein IEQ34_010923 [Dendrobium chrysotoxum]|uniref:Uncharacterized protein n=1 Tax=Dendrobium chrysotoxum TaxID=161865 RepID=A0AAV7GER0_DENCH|nr:hypothetical protein IEQ34_010923 [Dendrobium chrysotoxum]